MTYILTWGMTFNKKKLGYLPILEGFKGYKSIGCISISYFLLPGPSDFFFHYYYLSPLQMFGETLTEIYCSGIYILKNN